MAERAHLRRFDLGIEVQRIVPIVRPHLLVLGGQFLDSAVGSAARHMHAALGGKAEAVRIDHPVPERGIGRLFGMQLHRDIDTLVILAFVRESLLAQAGADHLQGFLEHRPRVQKRYLKISLLKRRHATPDPDFQAAVAHMVEHADFADQP